MAQNQLTVLREAIARNTAVAVTPGGRSRFLAVQPEGIWLEAWGGGGAALDALILGTTPLAIAFRHDQTKVEFTARALERRAAYPVNTATHVAAVLIESPAAVRAVQRRETYRVSVTSASGLTAQFWPINDADDVAVGCEAKIVVHDLSAGGIGGLYFGRKADRFTLTETQRLRVELAHAGVTLLTTARLRYLGPVPDPDNRRVGIEFDPADGQTMTRLAKMINELQRAQLRRKRA